MNWFKVFVSSSLYIAGMLLFLGALLLLRLLLQRGSPDNKLRAYLERTNLAHLAEWGLMVSLLSCAIGLTLYYA